MSRPVFNAGHYTHASGFEFAQNVFEQEARQRLLAVINNYGIVSGFGFFDDSEPGNPTMVVSQGLAFDGSGRMIRLTNAQRIAGLSTLSGLTIADINKIIVVENVMSGIMPEAHPITGEVKYTRMIDVPTFSVVASGAVDAASQVRIGRIYSVTEGGSAEANATTTNARDVLSYPKSSPFVVVGPSGDPIADYTGDDATPFNSAFAQLMSSNGGVVVVRPGTYVVDSSTPINLSGLDSVRVVGLGRITTIECPDNAPHWIVAGCGQVVIEDLHIKISGSSHPLKKGMTVRDCDELLLRDVVANGSQAFTLVSSISWARIEDSVVTGSVPTVQGVTITDYSLGGGGIVALHVVGNVMNSMVVNGEVETLLFSQNTMRGEGTTLATLSVGAKFSNPTGERIQPRQVILSNNEFISASVLNAASGAIINGNSFSNPSLQDEGMLSLYDTGIQSADSCVVSDNLFFLTAEPSVGTWRMVSVYTSQNVVANNNFNANSSSMIAGVKSAIELFAASSDNVVDANVGSLGSDPVMVTDAGSSNYATVGTNNTTNRAV